MLLATYANWIKKNPQQPMFYWGEAQVLEDRGRNAEAKSLLRKAIAIDPSCAPAYEDLSNFAATEGDVAAQRQYAKKALSLDPKGTSGVFFNYALTYLSTDPAKFRQVVLDRVAKYPEGLEYLLVLVAQNAPSPADEEAAYQKLYELYGPKSADPSGDISDVMVKLSICMRRRNRPKPSALRSRCKWIKPPNWPRPPPRTHHETAKKTRRQTAETTLADPLPIFRKASSMLRR